MLISPRDRVTAATVRGAAFMFQVSCIMGLNPDRRSRLYILYAFQVFAQGFIDMNWATAAVLGPRGTTPLGGFDLSCLKP